MTQPRGSTSLHLFGTYSKDVSSAGILIFPAQTAVLVMPVVRDQLGFPGGSDGKEAARNAGDVGSIPGSEDPLEKGMATHSSILAWRILGQRNLAGYSPWVTKLDTTEQLTLSHFKGLVVFNGHEVPLHTCV